MFGRPDAPASIARKSLDSAVTISPDFRQGARTRRQGVARSSSAGSGQAQDGTVMTAELLCLLTCKHGTDALGRIAAIAYAHQQAAIRQEQDARAKMFSPLLVWGHLEDRLDTMYALAIEHPLYQGGTVGIAGAGGGVIGAGGAMRGPARAVPVPPSQKLPPMRSAEPPQAAPTGPNLLPPAGGTSGTGFGGSLGGNQPRTVPGHIWNSGLSAQ